eukprot:13127330-Alexandrium_andersonii.AAC.1
MCPHDFARSACRQARCNSKIPQACHGMQVGHLSNTLAGRSSTTIPALDLQGADKQAPMIRAMVVEGGPCPRSAWQESKDAR